MFIAAYIYNQYDEVKICEINGQTSSSEYGRLLKSLQANLNQEQKTYDSIGWLDLKRLVIHVKFSQISESLIERRILNHLKMRLEQQKDDLHSYLDRIIQKNIDIATIVFLQKKIKVESNGKVRELLITTKYNLMFANPELGEYFSCNPSEIGENFNDILDVLMYFLSKENYPIYLCYYSNYCFQMSLDVIKRILNIGNAPSQECFDEINLIVQCCILRACILFMDDDAIEKVKGSYYQLISPDNHSSQTLYDDKLKRAIEECFENADEDKKIRKVLGALNESTRK